MRTFKVGDFVRVVGNVHDDSMPTSRMGHLLEAIQSSVHYNNRELEQTDVWVILMTNGKKLQFHKMYLEHVE